MANTATKTARKEARDEQHRERLRAILAILSAVPVGDTVTVDSIRWHRDSTTYFSTPDKLRYDVMAAARATVGGKL